MRFLRNFKSRKFLSPASGAKSETSLLTIDKASKFSRPASGAKSETSLLSTTKTLRFTAYSSPFRLLMSSPIKRSSCNPATSPGCVGIPSGISSALRIACRKFGSGIQSSSSWACVIPPSMAISSSPVNITVDMNPLIFMGRILLLYR